jgi:hypothetical protein
MYSKDELNNIYADLHEEDDNEQALRDDDFEELDSYDEDEASYTLHAADE